jgi:hypothetical protein
MRRAGSAVLVVLLPLVGGPVAAGTADRPPKVTPKDLPFTAAVAGLYPDLEGGSRYLTKQAKGVLLRSTTDCVATTQVARADRGTRADFFLAGGLDPAEQGVQDPTVSGFRFLTEDAAVTLVADVRDYVATCAGAHSTGGDEDRTVELTPLQAPDLGDEAVAMAITVTWPGGGRRCVDVLVRDGLSVSRVQVTRTDADPDLGTALELAGLAGDRLAPGAG